MSGPTAHVGYETTAGPFGQAREVYHAITDQPIQVGVLTRKTGMPVCGALRPRRDCPEGLFEPVVTCPGCLAICAREGIIVGGER